MRKGSFILALLLACLLCLGALAGEPLLGYEPANASKRPFAQLLTRLQKANEKHTKKSETLIDDSLRAIRKASEDDYEIALAITEHWRAVYLTSDYPLYCYRGGRDAKELEQANVPVGEKHAIVVLGYELRDGEMQDELKGRCRAAAAAARLWPQALLICSGGATGSNNPEQHTEADLMKRFLVRDCGIDTTRILTDTEAKNTAENAVNTFALLQQHQVETYTIVTSDYHQKWGQVLYNAVAALYRKKTGYAPVLVGNYCYVIEPSVDAFRRGDRIAISQLRQILGLFRVD